MDKLTVMSGDDIRNIADIVGGDNAYWHFVKRINYGSLSVDRILVSDSLPSLGRGTYRRISKYGALSVNVVI
ncbi:hypothetical protein A3D09_01130 [Candidatus Collierbacteria bacterium RIFCSPHIGHO2_02_FULL_49_10]|uniref:Uncharacterized protein n=2 Tax=Candidatus Collieribacteriota TaxID=1752725 RepID=A0A1F5EW25_9BACT|nr:MAG: hypothetical protein A3D09_01130 [Candidatus Collierbacteria bacterium RIFCSPHIGHO2_02_FULL_49_10]OGD71435.1 MAG: hypothetical protein A2703_02950 [Candidatus Collierbacteria bacterium RIFCSPHIGHO2_01_FULL_50_25]